MFHAIISSDKEGYFSCNEEWNVNYYQDVLYLATVNVVKLSSELTRMHVCANNNNLFPAMTAAIGRHYSVYLWWIVISV